MKTLCRLCLSLVLIVPAAVMAPAPAAVAASPLKAPFGLTANLGGDSATLFHTAPFSLEGTIPFVPTDSPPSPHDVALSADGSTAWFPGYPFATSITKLDLTTQTPTAIYVGFATSAAVLSPNGKTLYLNRHDGGGVVPFNTATNSVGPAIAAGANGTFRMRMSPDGSTLWVPVPTQDKLEAIDTATNSVVHTFSVPEYPSDLAISPDGTWGYVTQQRVAQVRRIDLTTGALGATIPTGARPNAIVMSPDAITAWVTSQSAGTVTPIDIASNTAGTPIDLTTTAPEDVVVDRAGTSAYVSTAKNLVKVDLLTNTVVALLPMGQQFPVRLALYEGPAGCTVQGTAGNDVLTGTSGRDTICGYGGDDKIRGKGDDDLIFAGAGDDLILPGTGADQVWGELGTDQVDFTGAGGPITADLYTGTATGQGSDVFDSVEELSGTPYNDVFTGGPGVNRLQGGDGNDTLSGGGGGSDRLEGQGGDDSLNGLDGSAGDVLRGGGGTDTCSEDAHDAAGTCESPASGLVTTTTVSADVDPSEVGEPVTITAHVDAGGPTPTGDVSFYMDGEFVSRRALDENGDAADTYTPGEGNHIVDATYSGGVGVRPSESTGLKILAENEIGSDCAAFQATPAGYPIADIRKCNLEGTGTFTPNWIDVQAEGATIKARTLSGGNVSGTQFIDVDMTRTTFSGVDATGANFTGSKVVSTRFTNGTNLTGADFTDAGVVSVLWSNVTCPDGTNSTANGATCDGHGPGL